MSQVWLLKWSHEIDDSLRVSDEISRFLMQVKEIWMVFVKWCFFFPSIYKYLTYWHLFNLGLATSTQNSKLNIWSSIKNESSKNLLCPIWNCEDRISGLVHFVSWAMSILYACFKTIILVLWLSIFFFVCKFEFVCSREQNHKKEQ